MNKIKPYLPLILVSIAAIAAIYLFWYKPKKDKRDAEKAAAQAAYDNELLKNDPLYEKLKGVDLKGVTKKAAIYSIYG